MVARLALTQKSTCSTHVGAAIYPRGHGGQGVSKTLGVGSIPTSGANEPVAQVVEQVTFNHWVVRSNRIGFTIYLFASVAQQAVAVRR